MPAPTLSRCLLTLSLLAAAPAMGSTLIYCSEGSPEGFDPGQYTSGITFQALSGTVYNRLIEFESGSTRIRPGLAESWTVSPDGKVYTFHLRRGVKFHTTPYFKPTRDFNADDVVFTWTRYADANQPFRKAYPTEFPYYADLGLDKMLDRVEKVDDHTVRFVLKQPNAAFLQDTATDFAGILSAEYAGQLLKRGTPQDINQKPVGTGPFQFRSYQKDASIRFTKNPAYWRGKDVKIDNLVYAITPDSAVRAQKLKSGECHVTAYLKPADIETLKRDPHIRMQSLPGLNIGYLAINTKKKWLDRTDVRRALDMAIDKQAILKGLYGETGILADHPMPPTQWGYDARLKGQGHDPKQAAALLKKAGVPAGLDIALWAMPVQRPYNPNAKRMAEMIQADWARVGVRSHIVSYEWGEYNKRAKRGEHDAVLYGWSGDNGDPDNWLGALLACDSIGGSNYAQWCNPQFDKLVTDAKLNSDPKVRTQLYSKAQAVFMKELPFSPIAHSIVYKPTRKEMQNFRISPLMLLWEGTSIRN